MKETWMQRLHRRWSGLEHTPAAYGGLERPADQRWGRICPHCGAASIVRTSAQITKVYSEQMRICQNPLCGHVWVDAVHAVRTLSPSSVPDANTRIPLSQHIKRERVIATMQQEEQLEIFGDAP